MGQAGSAVINSRENLWPSGLAWLEGGGEGGRGGGGSIKQLPGGPKLGVGHILLVTAYLNVGLPIWSQAPMQKIGTEIIPFTILLHC